MGKGADGCSSAGAMGLPSEGEILADKAIQAALDFKQDRIMVHTVRSKDIPGGWGLAPGFEHRPSGVGGTTARWSVLTPYLLENYPDDFMLIGSDGIIDDSGKAIWESAGDQYLAVRTIYPPEHERAGQPTDGLMVSYEWTKGQGVQGELREKLTRAQEEYNAHHFRELVGIRLRRTFGDLQVFKGDRQLIDDLPEDWNEQICNAVLNMPAIVWHDARGYRHIGGNAQSPLRSVVEGYSFFWPGSKIKKPVHRWNFNDGNHYVTPARLHAAAAWCGFLKDCGDPMAVLPNLVDKEEPLKYVKDEDGKLTPATGRQQQPLNCSEEWAKERLSSSGLQVETVGSGEYVIAQDPPVIGTHDAIKPGSKVTLTLGPRAEWQKEYIDSLPEKDELHRRKQNKIISKKQENLVFARLNSISKDPDVFYRQISSMLGIEPPSGSYFRKESWLRDQLKDFPQADFQKLLGYLKS